jgi:hypothetical protein
MRGKLRAVLAVPVLAVMVCAWWVWWLLRRPAMPEDEQFIEEYW